MKLRSKPSVSVFSVTHFEDGHRSVSFYCAKCGALQEDYAWPDGGLESGNILGRFHCVCGWNGNVVVPSWAFDPRHRTGYRRFLEPNPIFAGGDFGRDDQAVDNPIANWTE